MVTFKPVVYAHQRRADGTYNVKVKVTFKRKARHLPTTLYCTPDQLTRSLHIKDPNLAARAGDLVTRMQATLAELTPFELEVMDVDGVVAHIRRTLAAREFRLDFIEFGEQWIAEHSEMRGPIRTAINAFRDWLPGGRIDINAISAALLRQFAEEFAAAGKTFRDCRTGKLRETKHPRKKGSARRIIYHLGYLHDKAREQFNDEDEGHILIPRQPFARLKLPRYQSDGQDNLGIEVMQRIISARPASPLQRHALDVFVVSFALMGANVIDLWEAEDVDGVWDYNRAKTRERRPDGAPMKVEIPPQIAPYLKRLGAQRKGVWLPQLHRETDTSEVAALRRVNKGLARWAEDNGLPQFRTYAARHSWATIARVDAGVEKATVDESLAHVGDFPLADIYAERSWKLFAAANRRVLALFDWPSD